MADKQSLEYRGRVSTDGAAAYLESLARGLRDGHITIESGGELIESAVGDEVSLELEAESSSKGRFTISLELDWRLRRNEPLPPMLISSQPAPQPAAAQPAASEASHDGQSSEGAGYTGYSSE